MASARVCRPRHRRRSRPPSPTVPRAAPFASAAPLHSRNAKMRMHFQFGLVPSRIPKPPWSGPMFDLARQKNRARCAHRRLPPGASRLNHQDHPRQCSRQGFRSIAQPDHARRFPWKGCVIPAWHSASKLPDRLGLQPAPPFGVLVLAPAMAETTGSTISSRIPPISASLRRSGSMSRAGSKDRRSLPSNVGNEIDRDRSAPTAQPGIRVSPDHPRRSRSRRFRQWIRLPSGQRPPVVTVAAKPMLMVVLPVPGAPPKTYILPAASQPFKARLSARGLRRWPGSGSRPRIFARWRVIVAGLRLIPCRCASVRYGPRYGIRAIQNQHVVEVGHVGIAVASKVRDYRPPAPTLRPRLHEGIQCASRPSPDQPESPRRRRVTRASVSPPLAGLPDESAAMAECPVASRCG